MQVNAQNSASRRFWRTIIVVVLAGFVLGATQPNILAAFLNLSEGTYGMTFDSSGMVTDVDPGHPAARAGIEPGDRIEATSFLDRITVFESNITIPGTPAHLIIHRGAQSFPVTLRSDAP
jgi:S1-C subfamily serine protease